MAVGVDEAGGHGHPPGLEYLVGTDGKERIDSLINLNDLPVLHEDTAVERRSSGAVDYIAVFDQQFHTFSLHEAAAGSDLLLAEGAVLIKPDFILQVDGGADVQGHQL